MGHVWNLDLSDLFLDIYHFYMKALLRKSDKKAKTCFLKKSFGTYFTNYILVSYQSWVCNHSSLVQFFQSKLFARKDPLKFWRHTRNENEYLLGCKKYNDWSNHDKHANGSPSIVCQGLYICFVIQATFRVFNKQWMVNFNNWVSKCNHFTSVLCYSERSHSF